MGTVLRCLAVMSCAAGFVACKPIDDYWLKIMEPVIEKQLWEKSVCRYDGKEAAREGIRCAT